jgi:hypothetical protein
MKNKPYDAEPGLQQKPEFIMQTRVHRAKVSSFARIQGGLVYIGSIVNTETLSS